jgi:hypothetical protein
MRVQNVPNDIHAQAEYNRRHNAGTSEKEELGHVTHVLHDEYWDEGGLARLQCPGVL